MTATIGHNSPPAHLAMAMHIDELFTTVSDTLEGAEVTTDAQEDALADLLDDVRQAGKDADAKRKAEKQPHLDAGREVDANWNPTIKKANAAIDEIKAKLTPYRAAKQAAVEAEARKLREEAEAKEAAARKAMQSENLEKRVEAESQFERAKTLRAVANKSERAPTGLRTFTVTTVTDRRAALNWIAKHDADALEAFVTEYARRNAPNRPMDGVDVTSEKRAA